MGEGRTEGRSGQLGLAEGTLTLWHLDTSPTESTQQVRDDVVFDLVLGEPGENRQQPKHDGFELGGGAPVGGEGGLQREANLWSFGPFILRALSLRRLRPALQDVEERKVCFKQQSLATTPASHCWLCTWEPRKLACKPLILC